MENTTYRVHSGILASPQSRFINYFIDRIVIVGFVFLVVIFLGFVLIIFDMEENALYDWMGSLNTIEDFLVTNLIGVIYYIIFEALTGRTLGKYITKTCVVDRFGNRISFSALLKRSFARAIPLEQFSFLGDYARGWHDTLSDTYVVYVERLANEKHSFENIESIGKVDSDVN